MPTERPNRADRDYAAIARSLRARAGRDEAAAALIDALWAGLAGTGVSWVGVYGKVPEREELVLGPCRDRPACSPIGLHGVCGRAWRQVQPIVVRDVRTLGSAYVACDPRDRSELVLPLLDATGACWGVLDADSHRIGDFSEDDVAGFAAAARAVGLTPADDRPCLTV